MELSRASLDRLTEQVNAVSADAQARLSRVLARVDWSDVAAARTVVQVAMREVLGSHAPMAAQAAADFYDTARELAVGEALGAEPDGGTDLRKNDEAVRGLVQRIVDGEPKETFDRLVLARVDSEMKRAAANAMMSNARRDPLKPRYARVPSGRETCRWCIMLASRGFVYASEETAGRFDHWHPHCDCRVVPGWPGATVEGYDPDLCYDKWKHPEKYESKGASRGKRSIGAVYSDVYAARDEEVAKADLGRLKQTQLVHIAGSKQSEKTAAERGMEPSCFTMSLEEVHALIRKHAGHGYPDDLHGYRWNRKEVCTSDRTVGYVIGKNGDRIPTRSFKIHYSNNGVHAVPRFDEGDEPDDV